MSSHQPESGQSLKASYIFLMIVLTVGSLFLYSFAPWFIAIAVNGPLAFREVFQSSAPLVKHSILWNGNLCVPQIELNVFNPGMSEQSLDIIDLKTGDSRKIQAQFPAGPLRLVSDGETLWCLSGSTVYRIHDGAIEQTSTGTTLRDEPAFLYDGKLAVILEAKSVVDAGGSTFHLHVWTGAAWKSVGRVLLPRFVDDAIPSDDGVSNDQAVELPVDGQMAELSQILFQGPVETRVLSLNGQFHVFCSDGIQVLYSDRLEIIPDGATSALAPENLESQVPGWISAGSIAEFQVGADSRGLLLVDQASNFRNGTMNTTSTVKRLVDGVWKDAFELKRSGFVMDSTLVSDGARAFIVNQTLNNKVALYIGLGMVLYGLFWLVGFSFMEGRWGVTPGKWLVGIRVVRTTLRPCGFLRAALRELMLLFDGILCLGWMPGVFCITLTTCRQRMGDMLADTIVIRKPAAAADEVTGHG
jgi:uncharacterized RDD family membrane protein YckC